MSWRFGCGNFPIDFPAQGDFPGTLAENWDGGCREGAKRGSKERCFEVVRRQFVGEGEEAQLLCDRLPRRFCSRIWFS